MENVGSLTHNKQHRNSRKNKKHFDVGSERGERKCENETGRQAALLQKNTRIIIRANKKIYCQLENDVRCLIRWMESIWKWKI